MSLLTIALVLMSVAPARAQDLQPLRTSIVAARRAADAMLAHPDARPQFHEAVAAAVTELRLARDRVDATDAELKVDGWIVQAYADAEFILRQPRVNRAFVVFDAGYVTPALRALAARVREYGLAITNVEMAEASLAARVAEAAGRRAPAGSIGTHVYGTLPADAIARIAAAAAKRQYW